MARDGISDAEARRRLASQLPIDEKARRADYVIDTSGTFADTDRGIQFVWDRLRSNAS
jgi:dephospho-CoA kinase